MFWMLLLTVVVAALVLSRRRLGWLGASWRFLVILVPGAILGLLYILRLGRSGILASLAQGTGVPGGIWALAFMAFGALILASALRPLLECIFPSQSDRRDGDGQNHGTRP